MVSMPAFFQHAFDAVCIAGPSGLSVLSAAQTAHGALAAPSKPLRVERVRWLDAAFRGRRRVLVVSGPKDGSAVVVASERARLRALGHHTLEHPALASMGYTALAIVARGGKGGVLQCKLPKMLKLSFGTTHHYLLSLLAFDLVLRRRAVVEQGAAQSSESEHSAMDTTGDGNGVVRRGSVLKHSGAAGCSVTSEIYLTRYAGIESKGGSGGSGEDASAWLQGSRHNVKDNASLFQLFEGVGQFRSRFCIEQRLARRILRVLGDSPCGVMGLMDVMKHCFEKDFGDGRIERTRIHRVLFRFATRRLVRARVLAYEVLLCIDSNGRPVGQRSCVRLVCSSDGLSMSNDNRYGTVREGGSRASEPGVRPTSLPTLYQMKIQSGPVFGEKALPMRLARIGPGSGIAISEFEPKPRENPYSCLLSPDVNLQQAIYALSKDSHESGLSSQDLVTKLSCQLHQKHSNYVLACAIEMSPSSSLHFRQKGRTKETVLLVETEKEEQSSLVHSGGVPCVGQCTEAPNFAFASSEGGFGGDPDQIHYLGTSPRALDDVFIFPRGCIPFTKHIEADTTELGRFTGFLSPSTRQRACILVRLVQEYGAIALDDIPRVLTRCEGKFGVQIDRRAVKRVLDTVLSSGSARKVSFLSGSAVTWERNPSSIRLPQARSDSKEHATHLIATNFNTRHPSLFRVLDLAAQRVSKQLSVLGTANPKKPWSHVLKAQGLEMLSDDHVCRSVVFAMVEPGLYQVERKPLWPWFQESVLKLHALSHGFCPGVFARLRLYHIAAMLCVEELSCRIGYDLRSSTQSISSGEHLVTEGDIVAEMSLRSFACSIGIFAEDRPPVELMDTKMNELPPKLRERLLYNELAISQRTLMLSGLVQLGLASGSPGNRWSFVNTCSVSERKFEVSGKLPDDVFVCDVASAEVYWRTRESLFHRHDIDLFSPGFSSKIWDSRIVRSSIVNIEETFDVSASTVDIGCRAFWRVSCDGFEPCLDEECLVEREVRRCYERVFADRGGARTVHQGPIPALVAKALFRRVCFVLRDRVIIEKVAHYVRRRLLLPVDKGVDLALKSGKFRSRKRRWKGKFSLRERLSLLSMVCGMVAVLACQKRFKIRSVEFNRKNFVGAVLEAYNADDAALMWADISESVGLASDVCISLFRRMCLNIDLRNRLFEESVSRSEVLEGLDSGDGEDAAADTTMDQAKEVLSGKLPDDIVNMVRASVHRVRKRRRIDGESDPAASPTAKRTAYPVTATLADSKSPSTQKDRYRRAVQKLTFGVLLKGCADSHRDQSGADVIHVSSVQKDPPVPAVVELLRTILREPHESFRVPRVRELLCDLEEGRVCSGAEYLLKSRIARTQTNVDGSGRGLCLRHSLRSLSRVQAVTERHTLFQHLCTCLIQGTGQSDSPVNVSRLAEGTKAARETIFAAVHLSLFSQSLTCGLSLIRGIRVARNSAEPISDNLDFRTYGGSLHVVLAENRGEDGHVHVLDGSQSAAKNPNVLIEEEGNSSGSGDRRLGDALSLCLNRAGETTARIPMMNAILNEVLQTGLTGLPATEVLDLENVKALSRDVRTVVSTVALLVRLRLVARIVVSEDVETTGASVLYMPYSLACDVFCFARGRPARTSDPSVPLATSEIRPMTPWTSMDEAWNDDLCRNVQALVISQLLKSPGATEERLCKLCVTLQVPAQAVRDVLWAMVDTRRIKRKLVQRRVDACTLFSPGLSLSKREEPKRVASDFVDGLSISRFDRTYVSHFFLGNYETVPLLKAREAVCVYEKTFVGDESV